MTEIDRGQLRKLMEDSPVTVVEVLSEDKYNQFHLPGAINVPLAPGFSEAIQAVVGKGDPVVVYCYDADCDASPKAAARMEELGFRRVYDYAAGKTDWRKAGLPVQI